MVTIFLGASLACFATFVSDAVKFGQRQQSCATSTSMPKIASQAPSQHQIARDVR
jgi:hypothetical protein